MTGMRKDGQALGSLTVALVSAALIATAANAGLRPTAIVSRPPLAAAEPNARHLWSPEQVRELILLVEESGRHGLDPEDYGLAALRSELDQSATLYRSKGSRQLDALARASATALARAYRGRGMRAGAGGFDEASLTAALRGHSLRAWIGAPAVERS